MNAYRKTISTTTVLMAMLFAGPSFGQASNSRYVIKGDTVFDKITSLSWKRCSVGQRWEKGACTGAVKTFSFGDAQKQDGAKWRLPTRDELKTLIDPTRAEKKETPTLDVAVFPDMDPDNLLYWSRTHFDDYFGAGVSFGGGDPNYLGNRITLLAVRLVHSGP